MEQGRVSSGLGTSEDPPGGARDASDAFKQPDRIKTSHGDGERRVLSLNKRRLPKRVSQCLTCTFVVRCHFLMSSRTTFHTHIVLPSLNVSLFMTGLCHESLQRCFRSHRGETKVFC